MEIYLEDPQRISDVYTIANNGKQITVFCDFRVDHGYTYVSSKTYEAIDIAALYNVQDHAMIRILKPMGEYEVYIQQLSTYTNTDLSFQYNEAVLYTAPSTKNAGLCPYIYLGFLPNSDIQNSTVHGYSANFTDYVYTNCDGNQNNYFAFYFNYGDKPASWHGQTNHLMDAFNLESTSAAIKIPVDFYFDFEMYFGGCGGFVTKEAFVDSIIEGLALGLPWVKVGE